MGMLSLSSCVLIMMVTKFEQEVQMKHVPFYILKKTKSTGVHMTPVKFKPRLIRQTMSTLMFTFICYALLQPKRF